MPREEKASPPRAAAATAAMVCFVNIPEGERARDTTEGESEREGQHYCVDVYRRQSCRPHQNINYINILEKILNPQNNFKTCTAYLTS